MHKKHIITSGEIGERIKKRRKELKISQEELAETLDVTYQQVQRYENGMNKLNVENIQVIAAALSVPATYFFEREKARFVAEELMPCNTADESRLLRYFKKIHDKRSRNIVIQLAGLAAKAG
ncbi:MAG: XRE family transcriptional regulator [Nitrospirae bacterium]|nr:MAG: XRE family transcriptional regulator [Nitrospirota bacterium]